MFLIESNYFLCQLCDQGLRTLQVAQPWAQGELCGHNVPDAGEILKQPGGTDP